LNKERWARKKIFFFIFRFHKIANVNKALDFITSKGVKLMVAAEGKESFEYLKLNIKF